MARCADRGNSEKLKVLLGCTGSVASIKIPQLIQSVEAKLNGEVEIKLIPTAKSQHFFDKESLKTLCQIHTDEEEWMCWRTRGDPVLHIELRRWADIFVIAPLDANTMAKMVHGICDNLLTCVVRAWDMKKPLLFAPAMNTMMWEHPLTGQHIAALKSLGYTEIPCVAKRLACDDVGMGAMAEVDTIAGYVTDTLRRVVI